MWLVLAAAALICDPPSQELGLRVVDPNGAVVRGAQVRKGTGRGLTYVSPGTGPLGVYVPGFRPKKLTPRAGQIVVKLESADAVVSAATAQAPPCVTGSTNDGGFRLCSEDFLKRLPLQR